MCAVPRRELGTMEHSAHSSAARIAFSRTRRWWRYRTLAAVAKGTRRRRKKIRATSAAAVKGRRRRRTRIREASHGSDAHTPLPSPPRANPVAWRWASLRAHRSDCSCATFSLCFAVDFGTGRFGPVPAVRCDCAAYRFSRSDRHGISSPSCSAHCPSSVPSIGFSQTDRPFGCAQQPGNTAFASGTLLCSGTS